MRSLRDAQEAKTALQIAAKEINTSLKGAGCRIYNVDANGELRIAVEAGGGLPEIVTSYSRRLKDSSDTIIQELLPSAALIGATTRQGSALNGAIWVWRPSAHNGWDEHDQTLLREVADHLGVVIAQFDYQEKLLILSECDGLTRLLNRRTFTEKLTARLGSASAGSALFYVDIDNFKPVNDTHGHQRGDMVIKKLADILRLMARPDDLAGRMGGDEFVLWLDGIDRAAAQAMAQRLVASGVELRNLSASPEKPLGLSVGVALVPPGQVIRTAQLMEKADTAMYQAKRSGKSTWALVD
jgi:diguanylate cyclase (GGDEF)-like protein